MSFLNFHRPDTWFCPDFESHRSDTRLFFLSHKRSSISHSPLWPDSQEFLKLIFGYFVSRKFTHLTFLSWFIAKHLPTWKSTDFLLLTFQQSDILLPSSLPNLYLKSHICHECQHLIHLIAGYFSDFLQLSQSATRTFPSLPAPSDPEFGLLPQWPEISSVICSVLAPKI